MKSLCLRYCSTKRAAALHLTMYILTSVHPMPFSAIIIGSKTKGSDIEARTATAYLIGSSGVSLPTKHSVGFDKGWYIKGFDKQKVIMITLIRVVCVDGCQQSSRLEHLAIFDWGGNETGNETYIMKLDSCVQVTVWSCGDMINSPWLRDKLDTQMHSSVSNLWHRSCERVGKLVQMQATVFACREMTMHAIVLTTALKKSQVWKSGIFLTSEMFEQVITGCIPYFVNELQYCWWTAIQKSVHVHTPISSFAFASVPVLQIAPMRAIVLQM